jgi:hypothetical protein
MRAGWLVTVNPTAGQESWIFRGGRRLNIQRHNPGGQVGAQPGGRPLLSTAETR